MFSRRAFGLALLTVLSTSALGTSARADSGYQPYYYDRDSLQFSTATSPAVAARPMPSPASSSYDIQSEHPQAPATTSSSWDPFASGDARAAIQYSSNRLPPQPTSSIYSQPAPAQESAENHDLFPADEVRAGMQYNRSRMATQTGSPPFPQTAEASSPPESFDMGVGLGW